MLNLIKNLNSVSYTDLDNKHLNIPVICVYHNKHIYTCKKCKNYLIKLSIKHIINDIDNTQNIQDTITKLQTNLVNTCVLCNNANYGFDPITFKYLIGDVIPNEQCLNLFTIFFPKYIKI